jgi:hypothetical protein
MEALGRVYNVLPVADDVYVPMRDAGGASFICVNAAGDTWTLTEAQDAAGTGAQVLASISSYYTGATVGAAWVRRTQAAASTVVTTSAQDVAVIEVDEEKLSDGFTYVKVTSTSTGTVVALLRDLQVQRTPANLSALV